MVNFTEWYSLVIFTILFLMWRQRDLLNMTIKLIMLIGLVSNGVLLYNAYFH